jgi:hypothetical protein
LEDIGEGEAIGVFCKERRILARKEKSKCWSLNRKVSKI